MRSDLHREPRSRFICRRTRGILHARGLNVRKFGTLVAERYMQQIAPDDQSVDFYEARHGSLNAIMRAEKNNGGLVDRYISGVTRFPDDLEEPWIEALPEPDRTHLLRELAARYGQLGALLPDTTAQQHVACLADVLRDAGDIAKSLAPLIAKGRIEPKDKMRLRASLAETERALADVSSLHAQLTAMLAAGKR